MLHIVLVILKILGFLLLGLLCLLLVGAGLFLLVPLRYRGDAVFTGQFRGNLSASWFFHVLTLRLTVAERAVLKVKLLWFCLAEETLWSREKEEEPDSGPESDPESEAFGVEDEAEGMESEAVHMTEFSAPPSLGTETNKEEGLTEELPDGTREEEKEDAEGKEEQEEQERKEVPKKSRWNAFCDRISGKWKSAKNSFTLLREKYEKLTAFLSEEENQKTIKLLLRQIRTLIKHTLPRKLEGEVKFGFEDPYYTGQVLTVISPFYGLYAKKLCVIPVFDEKVLEGNIHLKGHIRAGTILAVFARMFMNRNFRKLLRKWRKQLK